MIKLFQGKMMMKLQCGHGTRPGLNNFQPTLPLE